MGNDNFLVISCSKTGHCTENTNVAQRTAILTNLIIDGVDFTLQDFTLQENLIRTDLVDLLHVATKGQLFPFDGALYQQTDGVAMRSPLGPLLANVFICSIEGSLKSQGKLPELYRRYVDDTLVRMPDLAAATQFLDTLNHAHSAVSFTIEVEKNGMLPFLGVQLLNRHHVLKQRFTSSRQTQGYSCTIIAMWTAATRMACLSQCLIVRTGYHHLGRIFQKSVNV